jgi:hypothetical protein
LFRGLSTKPGKFWIQYSGYGSRFERQTDYDNRTGLFDKLLRLGFVRKAFPIGLRRGHPI